MRKHYRYAVSGSGRKGQTWSVEGAVECEFVQAFDETIREAFTALTQGRAVYGRPGEGCEGPYNVIAVTIVQAPPGVAIVFDEEGGRAAGEEAAR